MAKKANIKHKDNWDVSDFELSFNKRNRMDQRKDEELSYPLSWVAWKYLSKEMDTKNKTVFSHQCLSIAITFESKKTEICTYSLNELIRSIGWTQNIRSTSNRNEILKEFSYEFVTSIEFEIASKQTHSSLLLIFCTQFNAHSSVQLLSPIFH